MIAAVPRWPFVARLRSRLHPNAPVPTSDSLPAYGIFRILVCRVTHTLGNTLLLTPLIQELQSLYPGAEIDIITRSEAAAEIFGAFARVRTIYCVPGHALSHPLRYSSVLRLMHRVKYDLVIDPCPRSQTGRLLLRLARGRFKAGFISERKAGSLTHGTSIPAAPRHAGKLPVYLLRALRQLPVRDDYPHLDMALSPSERQVGVQALDHVVTSSGGQIKRGMIGVFANATPPKLLAPEWWRRFMKIIEAHYTDYSIVEIVPMFGRSLLGSRYPAYYSSSIRKLSGTLSALSMFISADCGIMYLASASGAKTIGIFTETDAADWGPYGPNDCAINARERTPEDAAGDVIDQNP